MAYGDYLPRPNEENSGNPMGGGTPHYAFTNASKVAKQEEILRYLLTGNSLRECAKLVQVSYATVVRYTREPEFLNRLRTLSEEVFQELDKQIALTKTAVFDRINELSGKALDRMEAIIEKGGDNVAYKAAQDILDRNPEIPRNRQVKADVTQRIFNPADLIRAAAVADELSAVGTTLEGKLSSGQPRDKSDPTTGRTG